MACVRPKIAATPANSSELSVRVRSRLARPFNVGSLLLHSRVMQSPLAGVTDAVFRHLVRRFAPRSLIYTEMVRAGG